MHADPSVSAALAHFTIGNRKVLSNAGWLVIYIIPVVSRSVTLRLKSLNHCVSFTSLGALSITPSCASFSVSTRLVAESAARRTAPSAVLDTLVQQTQKAK
jgi:hypothetical protein